jgi:cytochrome b6-f complex iron-sulfur subunit
MSEPTQPADAGGAATTAPAAPKPAAPAPAAKPAPPKPPAKKGADRRGVLFAVFGTWFGIAWAAFSASMLAMILGTLRFMFPNVLAEPPSTFKAGLPDQYEPGTVAEQFKQEFGCWIIREGNTLIALSTTCTHLGCTPNWLPGENKFKCPCHGSGFKGVREGPMVPGTNFEGPAPRPLERFKISMADDGQILVDKSRKFQKELGQWGDPDASITL